MSNVQSVDKSHHGQAHKSGERLRHDNGDRAIRREKGAARVSLQMRVRKSLLHDEA